MTHQLLRRALQLSVPFFLVYAALGSPWRNFKVAHNHRRLVGLIDGDFWGFLYGLNEDMLAVVGEPYEVSKQFLAFPWSARVFGVDTADPLLVASFAAHNGWVPSSLLIAVLLPVGMAVLLGKVFCSHLCPMRLLFELAQAVGAGLARLGVELPRYQPSVRIGGWVLLGGLLASASAGMGVWLFVLPYVSLAAGIYYAVGAGAGVGLLIVAGGWFLVDLALAPGFFCRSLCPTGFLLENLGRWSLLRVARQGEKPCPRGCNVCQDACPYRLTPRERTHRPACDNCARCVTACPTKRLTRRLTILASVVAGFAVLPAGASAHHNKGMPHYGYFENYPQVPTEEYVVVQGRWEFGATIFNFQGLDRRNADTPNDVKVYCYLYDLEEDTGHTGAVDFEIYRDGERITRFERVRVDEEAIYSTRQTLPHSGEYSLVAHVGAERVTLPFYVDLATDRVHWGLVAAVTAPAVVLFGLALYGRKRRRRKRRRPRAQAGAAAVGLLGLLSCATTHAQSGPGEVCPYCAMINCTMQHFPTADGGSVMVMGGIPLWLFLGGVAALILLTFVGTEWLGPRVGAGFRLNLIGNRRVYGWVRSRWFQAVPQLLAVMGLFFLTYVGLFGSGARNLTPVAVWTIWWAGLIFAVLLFASVWCFICPWDGLANLVSRLGLASKTEGLSMNLRYPDWAKNMYPAIALFAVLTWLELGYGVTTDPRATAYMGLGMGVLAVCAALLWSEKRFCAHFCPVGRICGIYSNFAPLEIRGRKAATCEKCRTEDCLHGNKQGYPCPTGLSLKTVQDATMCTMCTECIKSCDKQNIALNLRPFGADLRDPVRVPRRDEAWLAVSLLGLTLFHGLSMTPAWESFDPGGFSILKWMSVNLGTPRTFNFTLGMALATGLPILLYWLCCQLSARWAQNGVTADTLFRSYAYALLPVALFYHLAHNLMHLLMEGGEVVPLLSDPMGTGADWLGTAGVHVGSLISESALWYMQVALILIGHVFGIIVAHRIGHRLYRDRKAAFLSLSTTPIMMVLISVCGLWLMHMDMNMRVGRM